ncbi:MAG: hypothetical protein ACRC30_08345 [Clostridium sp.]
MSNVKGFTSLNNSILFDNSISSNAKILYMQFKHFSNIPNFIIRKAIILKESGLSKNTFDKYLKELKDKCLIFVNAVRKGKAYEYFYTLHKVEVKEVDKPVKEDKPVIQKESSQSELIEDGTKIKLNDNQYKICKSLDYIVVKRVLAANKNPQTFTYFLKLYISDCIKNSVHINSNIKRYSKMLDIEFMPVDSAGKKPLDGQTHIDNFLFEGDFINEDFAI